MANAATGKGPKRWHARTRLDFSNFRPSSFSCLSSDAPKGVLSMSPLCMDMDHSSPARTPYGDAAAGTGGLLGSLGVWMYVLSRKR